MEIPTSNIAAHMAVLEGYARNCRVLIEIGAEHGTGSTHAFRCGFEANSDPKAWVTVDWKDQIDPWCRPRFPFWKFILGDSRLPETIFAADRQLGFWKADVIFIDTDHNYGQMEKELAAWKNLAAPNCTWLFHDTHMNNQYNPMTNAILEFAERENLQYTQLSTECHGLGAMGPRI